MKADLGLATLWSLVWRLYCEISLRIALWICLATAIWGHCCHAAEPQFELEQQPDRLLITYGGGPVATYVFSDAKIPRPYFAHVHAPSGRLVTRNHPPVAGEDLTDHADLHPGIWMAFGDLNSGDFWRNRDRILHESFVEAPQASGQRASFAVRNRYELSDGTPVCQEVCNLTFVCSSLGYILYWDSLFSSDGDFYFGDQEEMGLGIRVNTAISVQKNGRILDSVGRQNEEEIWGRPADWCDYSGSVDGQHIGIMLMCHPNNFRPCRMHARDYGFLAANPFGRKAFGDRELSKVIVHRGQTLRLRYGLLLHSPATTDRPNLATAFSDYVQQSGD